jgi:hypothetical protein
MRAIMAALMAGSMALSAGRDVVAASLDECPSLIVETFGEQAVPACSVALCESEYDIGATGRAGERGWFQIHPVHGHWSSYDPEVNVAYAYRLSRGGTNWSAWSCKP